MPREPPSSLLPLRSSAPLRVFGLRQSPLCSNLVTLRIEASRYTLKNCIIIGAGPAGLTAALELKRRTGIHPIVLEASPHIGGLSRTVHHNGNRMDIGGHRFFSKSDRVMQWWLDILPLEPDSGNPDQVMLLRPRKSRIYYLRKFFDYPVQLSRKTLRQLGTMRTLRIAASYLKSRLRPISKPGNLEDFLTSRFGRELYRTFFKSYTEKVWGKPCNQISADWGAQRIRNLSLTSALGHELRKLLPKKRQNLQDRLAQKNTQTPLIERFLYPKLGPGQLWECVASRLLQAGGELHFSWRIDRILADHNRIFAVEAVNPHGERRRLEADLFLSTMPIRDLTAALEAGGTHLPANVRHVSDGLEYRDFLTVGLLARRLNLHEPDGTPLKDNWIYIQDPTVLLGRLQIYNNWSPALVHDPNTVWLGLEYFCRDTDPLWHMPDDELTAFAARELQSIGILRTTDVLDTHIVRVPKAYPAYFGTYARFPELRSWLDTFSNLYPLGRNGMHKYNNQDHSMLTAMTLVDGLLTGHIDKQALWQINTEQEYQEGQTQKPSSST